MKIIANGIQIEVEDTGGDGRPVVLLIMGLGMQLIGWPAELVQALVDAGFRVVRHDNRDIGLSQGFDEAGTGNLVSIMSSSGARNLPGPRPDVAAALLRRPSGRTEAALVAHGLGFARLISSPDFPQDERTVADRITRAMRRAYRPAGVVRQMLAIGADSGRAEILARIASPSLVLHGEADPLVPIACGQDTARRIPGARFVAIPGMGHNLPPQVVEILLRHMIPFMQTAEKRT
jgi:pimeloyl-ACP methyl ester carboxylesterase